MRPACGRSWTALPRHGESSPCRSFGRRTQRMDDWPGSTLVAGVHADLVPRDGTEAEPDGGRVVRDPEVRGRLPDEPRVRVHQVVLEPHEGLSLRLSRS